MGNVTARRLAKGRLYVSLIVLIWTLAAYLASPGRAVVSGRSMEPTYHDGEVVRVDRRHRDLARGDVGVFFEGDGFIIKRVRAVAGDAVWEMEASSGFWMPIDEDQLALLRRTLAHERSRGLPAAAVLRRTLVPRGWVYVQGDNVAHTIFGLRRLSLVYGKVLSD